MIGPLSLILERYSNSSGRSKKIVRNIMISFVAKGVSGICSLLVIPLTINYVNPTQYGIWLTLSSIIGWVSFFDLGIGNGLRNKFAEAKTKGDMELARQYVSTTYLFLGIIVFLLLLIVGITNQFLNWPSLLNVDASYLQELRDVCAIVSFFFCINLVVRLFLTILTANQKPGLADILNAVGHIVSLIVIYILTITTEGSLFNLALYFSGIPTLLIFVSSIYAFRFTQYKEVSPRLKSVKINLVSSITNLGFQFFFISLSLIFIFQIMNVIISRELGPEAVTEYNIVYQYFNNLTILVFIILTPFWSAFTDAYNKFDYQWMERSIKKLETVWVFSVLGLVLMTCVADFFYKIWIGKDVQIHLSTTISLAIYMSIFNLGHIYMYLINGIGTIRIQLIIYLVFAIIAWPLMVLSCRMFGLPGIVIVPSMAILTQAFFGKIQISKIIHCHARGLWIK